MQWWEITFHVPIEASEAVSALLVDWSEVKGVAMEGVGSPAPHPEYGEWLDESLLHSDVVSIKAYVPDYVSEANLGQRLDELTSRIKSSGLPMPTERPWVLARYDEAVWQAVWKDEFSPIHVGKHLLIVPSDEPSDVPSEETLNSPLTGESQRLRIVLNPGMAFGTGTHATTRMCLTALEACVSPGNSVLDIGCGTAVLSIAAARLGAGEVLAVDIDPVAVSVARENVRNNHVESIVKVVEGDLVSKVPDTLYEVIIANILRDPVIALTPDAYHKLCTGGRFIVSGFITTQKQAVETALVSTGFDVSSVYQEEDWVALVAEKTK